MCRALDHLLQIRTNWIYNSLETARWHHYQRASWGFQMRNCFFYRFGSPVLNVCQVKSDFLSFYSHIARIIQYNYSGSNNTKRANFPVSKGFDFWKTHWNEHIIHAVNCRIYIFLLWMKHFVTLIFPFLLSLHHSIGCFCHLLLSVQAQTDFPALWHV